MPNHLNIGIYIIVCVQFRHVYLIGSRGAEFLLKMSFVELHVLALYETSDIVWSTQIIINPHYLSCNHWVATREGAK
jgi:hypothetical protein